MSYTFNNKHLSSIGFGLTKNNFPHLKKIKKEVSVVGRNGSIFIDTKAYDNRILECDHVSKSFTEGDYEKIYDFYGQAEGELILDSDNKLKWVVDEISIDSMEEEGYGVVHRFSVSFVCRPFRKLVAEKEYSLTTDVLTVENQGIIECYPNFEIVPQNYKTDIHLFVNGKKFTILDVDGSLGTVKLIGDSQTVIQNNKVLETAGDFPMLNKGSNTMQGSESYLSTKVSLNENYA